MGPLEDRYLGYIRDILKQNKTVHCCELSDEAQEILLRHGFSGCLYNEDDKPVCWGFCDLCGELLDGFTDPAYRGQGFTKPVNVYMEQEAQKHGQPHTHRLIATDNIVSQVAMKSFLEPLPQIIITFDYVPHSKCKY